MEECYHKKTYSAFTVGIVPVYPYMKLLNTVHNQTCSMQLDTPSPPLAVHMPLALVIYLLLLQTSLVRYEGKKEDSHLCRVHN